MKMSVNNKKICISLPEEQLQAIRALAAETLRTAPAYLRQLIRRHLNEVQEDPERKIK